MPLTAVNRLGPRLALAIATLLVIVTIAGTNIVVLSNLRDSTLRSVEKNLASHSLTLAEQADRSFQSLDLVLSSMVDTIQREGVTDAASYRWLMGRQEIHSLLVQRITGLPQIDAVTMIDDRGKLINFSRYWPIPDVNVSDRDYFKALSADPGLKTFISAPVQNRGTGTWTIYLARRISGADGEFVGLVLGAMALNHFEELYRSVNLGDGSAVSLIRQDGTLLARYPHTSDIGKSFSAGGQRALGAYKSGVVREPSPVDQQMRIKAAQLLSNYPLLILATVTEDSALVSWRATAKFVGGISVATVVIILIAVFAIGRSWLGQERLAEARAARAEADRARALAETELLRQQEQLAEASSRAKSSFLAVMSHEIRTPMNAVLGLASTLLETKLDDDQRRSIAAIHGAGDNLLRILNDILDFSKLDAGKLEFEALAFSPETITDNVLSILEQRAEAKGITLRADPAVSIPTAVLGDGGRIRQVLLNLVSNAVKFTPAGEVVIGTRCIMEFDGSATIEWSVSDSGIGIPPDRMDTLFNNFVQADSSINRRFGGSGLGLAISKRIIDQMGGTIAVSSVEGQGSTFSIRIELPLAEAGAIQPEHDNADAAARLTSRIAALGRPYRVLLAEDNATNQLVVIKMLKDFNLQIDIAGDGHEAVTAVGHFNYDLVFMDMRMPEMDGLEATRAIRARGGALATLPIVALTANAFPDDVQRCRQAGMTDFAAKPVRKQILIEAILRAGGEPAISVDTSAVAAAPAADAVDPSAYAMLAEEIGEDAATETLKVFVAETEKRLKTLRQLSCEADRGAIEIEAHTLKGAAGTFGLTRVSEIARELELGAANIAGADYSAKLEMLENSFDQARTQLPLAA